MNKIATQRHRWANQALSVVVIVLALYILVWPFLPSFQLWWRTHFQAGNGYVYNSKLEKKKGKPIPKDNRIVLPSLRMNEAINDGPTMATLRKGIWHRPATSSPDKGGNTVLVGHRFTYAGSAVFYNLDKLKPGDKIIVYWQHKEYDYKVQLSEVVSPNASQIEQATNDPILTLYTCTPLWSAHDRLVIIARPL
jgi:LPXTG-site transpeptidase (sortase) family protein